MLLRKSTKCLARLHHCLLQSITFALRSDWLVWVYSVFAADPTDCLLTDIKQVGNGLECAVALACWRGYSLMIPGKHDELVQSLVRYR